MTDEILFKIAKIIDNEYIGKDKTFSVKKVRGCYKLSTNVCDYAYFIKVFVEEEDKIKSILVLGEDTEDYQPIQPTTMQKVMAYLDSLINNK